MSFFIFSFGSIFEGINKPLVFICHNLAKDIRIGATVSKCI